MLVLCFLHPLGALTEGAFCCLTPALPCASRGRKESDTTERLICSDPI